MSRREAPTGNLLNVTDDDDIRPPPRPMSPTQSPRGYRRRWTQEVPTGDLIGIGGNDYDYIPPTPPMPGPATPADHRTVMRYKPVPGKPGRMQPMFSRDYYEDIERRYPNDPLTLPEMYNMYEYPNGQDNSMGPWLRDPLDMDRLERGVSILPGERATGFDGQCGTDPDMPYGPESGWMSDEWDEIMAGTGQVGNTEDEQREILQQMIARTQRKQQEHEHFMGREGYTEDEQREILQQMIARTERQQQEHQNFMAQQRRYPRR